MNRFVYAVLTALSAMVPWAATGQVPPSASGPSTGQPIYGLYCSGFAAGNQKMFNSIVKVIDDTYLNAIVIDVKGDSGRLSYKSTVPLALRYGTGQAKIPDITAVMRVLKEKNIFPIARIVAFKDSYLAGKKPEWAVRDISGTVWNDRKGAAWIDPYNRKYWDYLIDIAREAAGHGFREIQFDYVRFTTDGEISRCVYPAYNRMSREDLISDFLKYARQSLALHGVAVSADIFGLSTSLTGDVGIGQQFEKVAAAVDVVCPMVYPSHYGPGNFGMEDPDSQPYRTVLLGVSDGVRRLNAMRSSTIMRPWLQVFSLRNKYGREQIRLQVKAVKDAGASQWLFWNPGCTYKAEYFEHDAAQAEKVTSSPSPTQ